MGELDFPSSWLVWVISHELREGGMEVEGPTKLWWWCCTVVESVKNKKSLAKQFLVGDERLG